jgi:small conductance mechanosensitive channel
VTTVPAIAPLTDIGHWARGDGLEIVLLILGAILLVRFAAWVRDRVTAHLDAEERATDRLVRSEETKHRHALAQALTWVVTVVIWAVAVALVLLRLGVPFASRVAPITVIGAAIGIGAQQLVRDLIGGVFIIAERQYGFGDLIQVAATTNTDGARGTVEDITLRVTRLRSADGEVIIIPNGHIMQVTNLSSDWARAVVDIPLPAGVDVSAANDVLRGVGRAAAGDETLGPLLLDAPTVMGVESFEIGQINLRLVARTLPGKQFEVARRLRVLVAAAFQREGIVARTRTATDPPTGAA